MSAPSGHKRQTDMLNNRRREPGSRNPHWRPPQHWEVDAKEAHGPVTTRQPTPEQHARLSRIHQPDIEETMPTDPQARLAQVREQLTWLQERVASEPDEYQDCLDLIKSFTSELKALEFEVARLKP